ncbi:EthD domain-containing protein [Streptomyces sp. 900105755]
MDYSERDSVIRRQTYNPVRRLPGLPQELFQSYWRDVHGPLCSRLPGLGYYVQYHFSREGGANLWPRVAKAHDIDVVLDGAVELGFANQDDEQKFVAASTILFGDEFNLFEHDNAYSLPNGSRTLIDTLPDPIPNGPSDLHRLHLHISGGSESGFHEWAQDWAKRLATLPEVRRLRLHQPEPYDNSQPAPPSPGVNHVLSDDRLDVSILDIAFDSPLTARSCFATDEFSAIQDEQAEHVRAIKILPVSGVYTYVRDGVPTTAGLRGSNTALLIQAVGARNQTQDEVTRLFVTE